jgi:hypothetical protein
MRLNTIETMLAVVEAGPGNFGKLLELSWADQLLLTLMHWREYRMDFHIGLTYGL